ALGLLFIADAFDDFGVVSAQVALLVLVGVFGAILLRSRPPRTHPEVQVDLNLGDLRIGRRRRGVFHPIATLKFADVASVYLLRSKDRRQPTRLFLRIGDGEDSIEIAEGPAWRLERLRQRLVADLSPVAPKTQADVLVLAGARRPRLRAAG
ncbi:MAG: hypothetical protein D6801_00140, partial [Alphaproteobacteria bacterium]